MHLFSGKTIKTLAAIGVAAGALTAVSSPASADETRPASSRHCLYFLNTSGYPTTDARAQACEDGAGSSLFAFQHCYLELLAKAGGVTSSYVAETACDLAGD
jgi:hypothetical protein